MKNKLGIHGQKIDSAINNEKVPKSDKQRLKSALNTYEAWANNLDKIDPSKEKLEVAIKKMVRLLNDYKLELDYNTIFCSDTTFLYRQKGQIKLDNTVMEEFLPIFVKKCLQISHPNLFNGNDALDIASQTKTFSSLRFNSSLVNPGIAGSLKVKTKDQDFALSRKLFVHASFDKTFSDQAKIESNTLNLGYVVAELKTNLDKTMFQEASATASDIKHSVSKAHYYLLCDFLGMTPISTATTDIDGAFILRKAKRISSDKRKEFSNPSNRKKNRNWYKNFLQSHPYDYLLFEKFFKSIDKQLNVKNPLIDDVLKNGYF